MVDVDCPIAELILRHLLISRRSRYSCSFGPYNQWHGTAAIIWTFRIPITLIHGLSTKRIIRVYPVRGQMSAQSPGDQFPSQGSQRSWIFNYERGFDYLTQLPSGAMMFGSGLAQSEGAGLAELAVSRDSGQSLYIDIHLSGALRASIQGVGER